MLFVKDHINIYTVNFGAKLRFLHLTIIYININIRY